MREGNLSKNYANLSRMDEDADIRELIANEPRIKNIAICVGQTIYELIVSRAIKTRKKQGEIATELLMQQGHSDGYTQGVNETFNVVCDVIRKMWGDQAVQMFVESYIQKIFSEGVSSTAGITKSGVIWSVDPPTITPDEKNDGHAAR